MKPKRHFKIGEYLIIKTDKGTLRKFKIKNIAVNNVMPDTEINQLGVMSYACKETFGKLKDELMFIFIEMIEVDMD
jgi:hypothetical protein